jgi:formylglycine-generating enzyme required for sulfatase activity
MLGKAIVIQAAALLVGFAAMAAGQEYIDPNGIIATASSVNYQLEPVYSCSGAGLAGDLHTNRISTGAEPPPPGQGTMWLSEDAPDQWIQYEFDTVYSISSMLVWNYNQADPLRTSRGVRRCTIDYSADGAGWSRLGDTHTFAQADGTDTYMANTEVDFGWVDARYVRINVIDNHGGTSNGLSEVKFQAPSGVGFAAAASGGPEAVAGAVLAVRLFNPPENGTITVDYAAGGGTAEQGLDYELAAGTLTFEPAVTSQDINIAIFDDGFDEQDETIEVTLSNAAGIAIGGHVTHTYTIIDPRPAAGFAADAGFALENVSPAGVEVILSAVSQSAVTVGYGVTGGTAEGGGVDYTLDSGTVTFEPGQTSAVINIPIVDDDLEEGTETIDLAVGSVSGAKLGAVTTHTYSIMDDELGTSFTNSIGMEFVRIEPGTFSMGSTDGEFDEVPVRQVDITYPFYIGRYEVTNAQYEQYDPDHTYMDHRGFSANADEAVIFVTWHDANDFCRWLSGREGRDYRLATEAEWEYACRAGTTGRYNTGDTCDASKQQRDTIGPDPVDLGVGATGPNAWGLYDVHGNVEEWTRDWYGPYAAGAATDPVGRIDGDFRVTRGGSHSTPLWYLRSANRLGASPDDSNWLIGFRVVMAPLPATEPLPVPDLPRYATNVSQQVPADIRQGPDPGVAYFADPRRYVFIPSELDGGPLFNEHNHVPGIVECPNGDLLIIWYSTVGERDRELAVAASRLRYGDTQWEDASVFWNTPDRNNHTPCIWLDERSGRIYHFNGVSDAYSWNPLAVTLRTSDDNGVSWTRARVIIPDHDIRQMPIESVFRTTTGKLVLPCDAVPGGSGGTALWMSGDDGLSWYDPGGTIAGIHAAAAEISGGRLLAFGRSDNIDGRMPKSVSSDMGQSWDKTASVFDPIASGQRCVLLRLRQGPLFFASFGDGDGLLGGVSFDEGETWPSVRLITDGSGRQLETMDGATFTMDSDSAEPLGYLSVCQGRNGLIHLISSRQHYVFNLKWLASSYVPSAAPCGDLDGDGTVGWGDIAVVSDGWLWVGIPGGNGAADIDGDGYVDLADYALMAGNWQESCP